MKKRITSLLFAAALLCSALLTGDMEAQAAKGAFVDGSYLTDQESSVGEAVLKTRGVYLMTGDCSISKAGSTRVYCYASTTANMTVDYVCVIVYVEQYDIESGKWEQIDSWVEEDTDTYYVSTSDTVKVDSGYFYRVRADHIAGPDDGEKDLSGSVTDGIWVGLGPAPDIDPDEGQDPGPDTGEDGGEETGNGTSQNL